MSEQIYTAEYFREQGRKGGQKTKDMYGKIHFINMRKKVKKLSPTTPLSKKKKGV